MRSKDIVRKKQAAHPRVVLDSNVFISAIVFGGKPRDILSLAISGKVKLALSGDILDEIRAVLTGKKFRYPARVLYSIEKEIVAISEIVDPKEEIQAIPRDPADNKVLACAVEAKSNYIISGDVHLLELGRFRNIKILSPEDFLREYEKR